MLAKKIKFNRSQTDFLRNLSIRENMPDRNDIIERFPWFSSQKLEYAFLYVKRLRKELSVMLGMSDVEGVHNSNSDGWIYLIENEEFGGWIKCGMTSNIKSRLSQYNCSDPLSRFNVIVSKKVKNKRKAEIELISVIKNNALISNGEWFKIDKEQAIEIFDKI
jgi:hypothetical protein